jgi:hypothetical protein
MPNDALERCNTIEETYEFMLAYAAQGLPTDGNNPSGSQIREFLNRAVNAISGLKQSCAEAVSGQSLQPAERYEAFLAVVDRDARDSLAAIELVLAQPTISSQLIDNLNASIHLRALLTDLFLLGEILNLHQRVSAQSRAAG